MAEIKDLPVGEIIYIYNGLQDMAKLPLKDVDVRWTVIANLKKARDVVEQFNDMMSAEKSEDRQYLSPAYRKCLKVVPVVIFKSIKKIDLEKENIIADIQSKIFAIIEE